MKSHAPEFFMGLAIQEAQRGLGRTSPNPAVGAVLVKGGRVIARGHHAKAGGPHAEVVALRAAGARAKGADLYTTLEPCDHFGKTGPCTEAIVNAGVRRVFVASTDPNPKVNGRGIARLRRARIHIVSGILTAESDALNAPWYRYITSGRPYITLKVAMTLDGKIAAPSGDSRWVTGEAARRYVHELRSRVDAVIVGAGTARADNPRLTARVRGGRDPIRVVLDSRAKLPRTLRVFRQRSAAPTLLAHVTGKPAAIPNVEWLRCSSRAGRIDVRDLLRRLAGRGISHALVEGGAEVFSTFLAAGVVDRMLVFVAPKLIGGQKSWVGELGLRRMKQALKFDWVEIQRVGADILLVASPRKVEKRRRRS